MSNSVDEYWEVDGVSLHTWAWAIETLSGREGIPPRRGSNVTVAYRPGEVWRPKVFGPRVESLAMWVRGCDVNGVIPGAGARAQFRQNLESLKSMFGVIERELVLTRRIQTLSSLLVQTGKGECVGTIDPNMNGATMGKFVADIHMADPFWYGAQVAPAVPLAGATITNVGSVRASAISIALVGPLTGPVVLTNQTLNIVLTYAGTIAGGETVTIDTAVGTAVSSVSGTVTGLIQHSGSAFLMELKSGANVMLLAAGGGSGQAALTYKPPYF